MKLTSMKLDRAASAEKYASPVESDRPAYPYGLQVRLDTDALKKLGLDTDLPEVGQVLKLTASVDVTSVSENESAGGGKSCDVSLQITDMALQETKDASDTLYKKA